MHASTQINTLKNQSSAAVTALKSTERKVGLNAIQKNHINFDKYTDCSIREYWSANVATELQNFYG